MPQIFYDIIALLIPGLVFTLILVSILMRLQSTNIRCIDIRIFNFYGFILYCLLSYFCMVIIRGLSKIKICYFKKKREKLKSTTINKIIRWFNNNFTFPSKMKECRQYYKCKKICVENYNSIISNPKDQITIDVYPKHHSLLYDFILLTNPFAGQRLVKVRAEAHMLKNFVHGFILLEIINLFVFIDNKEYLWFANYWIHGLLILCIILFGKQYYHRRESHIWGLCNHWLLLKGNETLNT